MTVLVQWKGRDYDLDVRNLTTRELDLIQQRTALDWYDVLNGLVRVEPNAIRAIFWVHDQRDDAALSFRDYDGPPLSVVLDDLPQLRDVMQAVGKAIRVVVGPDASTGPPASGALPSNVDTPPASSTP